MKIKLQNLLAGTKFDYKGTQWILLNNSGLCMTTSSIFLCSSDKPTVTKYLELFSDSLGQKLRLPTIKEFYKYDDLTNDGMTPYYVAIFDGPLVVSDNSEEGLTVPEENNDYGLRPVAMFDLEEEVTILDFDFSNNKLQAITEIDKLIETLNKLREEIGGNNNE